MHPFQKVSTRLTCREYVAEGFTLEEISEKSIRRLSCVSERKFGLEVEIGRGQESSKKLCCKAKVECMIDSISKRKIRASNIEVNILGLKINNIGCLSEVEIVQEAIEPTLAIRWTVYTDRYVIKRFGRRWSCLLADQVMGLAIATINWQLRKSHRKIRVA